MAEETTGIRLAGLGGQGVVLAGLILGHAAVCEGLYAAGSSSYGAQSRGSVCKADLVIAREAIDYPHIEMADLLIAMSLEGYDAFAGQVAEAGRIFFDAGLVSTPRGNRTERGFDVSAICARELQERQSSNMVWIGILAGATGLFSESSLEQAIREHVPERYLDLNLRALRLGLSIYD